MELTDRGPHVHSGADVPLLRHGAGHAVLRGPRRDHGLRGSPDSMPSATHGGGRGRTLHRAARRAHHVHRRSWIPPGFADRDLIVFAHRHHRRCAVPGRIDEADHGRDAHGPDHHRLWHDRDRAGQHPDLGRRSGPAAGRDRGPGAAAHRDQDRRRRRAGSCRAAHPASC